MNDHDPIVGHKTMKDGTHLPLLKSEADAILAKSDRRTAERAERMPDERSAINAMFDAWLRLKELGWREAKYCPKDGTSFDVHRAWQRRHSSLPLQRRVANRIFHGRG